MHSKDQRLITSLEEWKVEYRKDKTQVWVIITLSDDSQYFFKNGTREEFEYWPTVVEVARKGGLSAKEIGLRYRSNVYRQPISGDGIYITRSALGSPGSETISTMTIGVINKEIVSKTIIQLPSLIIMSSYEDILENCFTEATWIWQ